jgi:hypothetical protein
VGIVVFVLLVWLMSRAVKDAHIDHTYAKQGMVSPRMEARYGGKDRASARVAKYGFTDHLRDNWRDLWARRTDAVVAARNARAANGGRPRWRDRVAAADAALTARRLTPETQPVPRQRTEHPVLLGDGGMTTPVAQQPQPPDDTTASPAEPAPAEPDTPTTPAEPAQTSPAADTTSPIANPAPTNGGTPMTAATGEAVNYEMTVAQIDAMIAEVQTRIDADNAALTAMAEVKTAVDAMQQNYQSNAEAAATKLDHETALNLDGTTLGHAGTTVDALPVGAVDGLYDRVEEMELETRRRLEQDEIALAALEAERAHLIATYGDAHATVAGNLGGDSRFLDGGGTLSSEPAGNGGSGWSATGSGVSPNAAREAPQPAAAGR